MSRTDAIKRELITIGIALIVSIVAGSILVLLTGESPIEVFKLLLASTWGDKYGFGQVIFYSTPLIMTGLAVALAFKVGLFNIGAEGQMIAGSFATGLLAMALPEGTPSILSIPLSIAAGMVAGGFVGAIPGILKAYYGAHEVINTIMLNFIAATMVLWLGNDLFFVKETTRTEEIIASAQMSNLHDWSSWFDETTRWFKSSNANTSILLAILLATAMHLFLTRTRRGFEWRAVGLNMRAAENGGINVKSTIIQAMAASGALAGAVGANFVLGYKYFFEYGMGAGVGFMGIAVALLGRNHPFGIIAGALLFGTLSSGGLAVNVMMGVPKELVYVLQAVIILAVAATAAVMYRRQRKKTDTVETPGKGESDDSKGKGGQADG